MAESFHQTLAVLVAVLLCAQHAASGAAVKKVWHLCGTADPSRPTLQTVQALLASQPPNSASTTGSDSAFTVTVPVVWHVIFSNSSGMALRVGKQRSRLNLVLAQMTKDFNTAAPAGYRYKFVSSGPTLLHKISTFERDDAFCSFNVDRSARETKARFRRGDACTLNLYIVEFDECFFNSLLGIATFPWGLQTDFSADGVLLATEAIPGYNTTTAKHVTTHEAGHWFGLLHTFQYDFNTKNNDGCKDPWGDFVTDTPKEGFPHYSGTTCSEASASDSCPRDKGKDPWWNSMSYFGCETQRFSKMQHVRMKQMHSLLRQPYCLPPPTTSTGPILFGPDCTGSRVVNGVRKGCCDTAKGFFCYQYKQAGSPSSTYATCMTPQACKASASGNPAWQCSRKAACHK